MNSQELMGEASASPQVETPTGNGRGLFISKSWTANCITPIDELTNLPLPLMPTERVYGSDLHHHFHAKRHPALQGVSGKALRNARLQKTDYVTHHHYYHGTYVGPPLPESEDDKFALVIMAVAGYMPNEAIEFHKGKSKVVPLAFDTRRRLQTSGEIVIGSKDAVQRFIREYVLGQDIDSINVKDAVIDEFLTTENEQRRLDLGHNLLGLITDKATEHLKATYLLARQRELTMPGIATDVRKFTKTSLGSRAKRDHLVGILHGKLAA